MLLGPLVQPDLIAYEKHVVVGRRDVDATGCRYLAVLSVASREVPVQTRVAADAGARLAIGTPGNWSAPCKRGTSLSINRNMHPENIRRRPAAARPSASFEVQPSTIHGRGVFALADLEAGQNVGRYAGRRYPAGAIRPDWDGKVTYLFLLSDGTLIDGARGGNLTRHINHACRPNVEAVEVRDARGVLGIQVRTKRRIRRGEELLLDYALDIPDDDPSNYRCRCGDKTCRGSLAAN